MSAGSTKTGVEAGIRVPACFCCDAYLFDIDGTLLNTRDGVHYHAFHHAVREIFGVDSHIDGVPVHGNTDIGILRAVLRREGVSDEVIDAKMPAACEYMCRDVESKAAEIRPELCPSVNELLDSLKRSGKLMGIVSGNLKTIGWLKLRAAGIADYFSFGCFSDHAELRSTIFNNGIAQVQKRLGSEASACVVGDTPTDILAARETGLSVIAVATGIFTADELRQHDPDSCAGCCTELLQWLG